MPEAKMVDEMTDGATMDDEAARRRIRTDTSTTLFVAAGAGTGKTTELVARVLQLVRDGVPLAGVAAITFTEAAAAELRDRVRAGLEDAARREDDPRLREAIAQVDDAAVTTLHAFAQRILAEHSLAAGLPPSFDVLDEVQSELLFEARWATFLDQLLDDPDDGQVLLRSLACGMRPRFDPLREMARACHEHWDRLDGLALPEPALSPVDRAPVVAALRAAVAYLDDQCVDRTDKLALELQRMGEQADRLTAAGSDLEALHLLASARAVSPGQGRCTSWRCTKEEVQAAVKAANDARAAALATVRQEVLARLLVAVQRFTLESAADRRAQGRLDFQDLLVLARNVVRDDDAVRRAVRARYSHLLIDEFQDTDPLQEELASMLAPIDEGRSFYVGDGMQSIYRFRRADIGVYSAVRERVGEVLTLTRNHRSVPGILAWVNALFAELVGDGRTGVQPAYVDLEPARRDRPGEVPVAVIGRAHDAPAALVRELEAAEVAATISAIHQGGWPVRADGMVTDARPADWSDIAILLPTRTSLPQLEAALDDAGIPYRVDSASLVWGSQEVRDLLAVLRAVDDPTDAVAAVAALRAPAFACGDDDLLEFRQAGGRWDYLRPAPESLTPAHPVVQGLAELAELHSARWWTGVSGMVERVTRQLRFLELAFAHRRPRDSWRRLRWVVDQARAFEEDDNGGLREFVAWATRQGDDDVRVKDAPLPESDDLAVRISTIHGAKGLEYPIVVLAGLARPLRPGGAPAARLGWDADGRPQVKTWYGFETAGFAALAETEKLMERHEQLRLLYVAATRAQDHLVVSVHRPARGPGRDSLAGLVATSCGGRSELWRALDLPGLVLQPPATAIPAPDPDEPARRQAWKAARRERLATLGSTPVYAATAVAELGAGAVRAGPIDDEVDDGEQRWLRARAGTSVGRAVHAVLQSVDLATGDGLAAVARAQAAAEGVDDRAAEVERLARVAMASPSVAEAVQSRHWRELYVAAPVGDAVVEGFVDLLYESPAGLVVLDYKTDTVHGDADIDAALVRYRLQAASYALCLETSLGRPVAACRLVFLRAAGGAEERAVDDLPAAIEEVRRLVAGARQAGGAQAWSGPAADAAPSKLASPNANTPPSEPMSR